MFDVLSAHRARRRFVAAAPSAGGRVFGLGLPLLLAIASLAHADTLKLAWDSSSDPDVTGYVVHVGHESGVYGQHFAVGLTNSFDFTLAVPGQRYCFAVTASREDVSSVFSNEICGYSNMYPSLAAPVAQSTLVGTSVSLQVVGTDPSGDRVTFGASNLPPGLSIDPLAGLISGTPSAVGSFLVKVTVHDGVLSAEQSFRWTIIAAGAVSGPASSLTTSRRTPRATSTGRRAIPRAVAPPSQTRVAAVAVSQSPAATTGTDVSLPLPEEWSFRSIGAPAITGRGEAAGRGIRVTGAGNDIWDGFDQFSYVYRPVPGDVTVTARVEDLNAGHAWAKAGLMVRSSLAADAAHAFVLATPGNGIALQGRPQAGSLSQTVAALSGTAPAWLKLERRGVVVDGYASANGTEWTPLGSMTIALPEPVYVGVAVTSHDASQIATATFDTLTIQEVAVTGNNIRPTVTLTSPAAGSNFTAPAPVTLTAAASDPDGSIDFVQFHAGTTLLGTVTSPPYTLQWNALPAGTYTVTATAFDNRAESSTSSPVSFTVAPAVVAPPSPPANLAPTVSLTAPAAGATFTAPAAFTISANAADSDGSISGVDFYVGSTLIGSDTSSPFSITWSNVDAGTYAITAVARDNVGASTTSSTAQVTVAAAPVSPFTKAVFTPSADHDTLVQRYVLNIFGTGSATPVTTRDLGKPVIVNNEISVDISSTIQPLPAGGYTGTVTAVGANASSTSAPAAFTK